MRAAVALAVVLCTAAAAQPVDTLAAPPAAEGTRTPRGAVTRALVLPGLGQVYNREPLKAPVAAALVGGAAAFAVFRQRRYLLYRRATVFAGCRADDGVPDAPSAAQDNARIEFCGTVAPDYRDEWVAVGALDFGSVRLVRDQVRGQRDVGVLVALVAYAAQALDAYVAAELADFDVSEDLSIAVDPGPEAPGLALRLRIP